MLAQIGEYELFDKNPMKVLSSIADLPKSAKEISSECDLPISTVYRKLHFMHQKGLLKISGTITDNGVKTKKFVRKQITIELM